MKCQFNRYVRERKHIYRGNLSASNTATSTPSRARHDAAYEPPGPPPMTRTATLSGCSMVSSRSEMYRCATYDCARRRHIVVYDDLRSPTRYINLLISRQGTIRQIHIHVQLFRLVSWSLIVWWRLSFFWLGTRWTIGCTGRHHGALSARPLPSESHW